MSQIARLDADADAYDAIERALSEAWEPAKVGDQVWLAPESAIKPDERWPEYRHVDEDAPGAVLIATLEDGYWGETFLSAIRRYLIR
ncbi:MAG: hypothetical protein LBL55_08535 [Propionibacteriaceae bacterium]|nr:hypothetical protein [Propionibacteriaceae bacterium]